MRHTAPTTVTLLLATLASAPALSQNDVDGDPGFQPAPATTDYGGLLIPDGVDPQPPATEFALYSPDGDSQRVVRVLAELGQQRLVKLPSGKLAVAARNETDASDGPFVAASDEAVLETLRGDGLGDFKTERAGYYFFAYGCTEAYYLHTRSILQSMLRGVVKQLAAWGLKPARPESPLVVIIMPNRTAFDAFQEMPDGVAAYYNGISNYVVLYEDDRLFDAAPEFALKQGSYVIAHEAIHQLLHNTGIQQRLSGWPAWVSEGVPEYFCPLRVHSSLAKKDGDELPIRTVKWTEAGMVNDLRMHDLLRTPGKAGEVIRSVVAAPGLTAHGYSVAWGLVHYLATKREQEFKSYLADVRKRGPLSSGLETTGPAVDPLFVKHFGDDYATIEAAVQRHLTSRKLQNAYSDPYVNQTHYVVSVTFKRGRVFYTRANVLLSPAAARQWTRAHRKTLDAEKIDAHILTRECRTAKEAEFYVRKIMKR